MTPDTLHDLDNSGDATISQRAAAACLHRDDGDHRPRASPWESSVFFIWKESVESGPAAIQAWCRLGLMRCDGCSSRAPQVGGGEGGAERAGLREQQHTAE